MSEAKKTATYGITFTKFDPQYQDCIVTRKTKKALIEIADKIVRSVTGDGFSLLGELNKMQGEAMYAEGSAHLTEEQLKAYCFYDKYSIPFYFINLLLAPYGMKLGVVEVFDERK